MKNLVSELRRYEVANTPSRDGGAGGVAQQIPRNSLVLLMLAQVVVVLPHAAHLSLWIVAVGLFCGWWRAMVYQGRFGYPRAWVKLLLVLASGLGVAISEAGAFSLETAVGLLIVAFALKLLEMKTRRDAYLVIFLSYFVISTEFLFDQSIPVAAYALFAMVVVTAGMIGLNQMHTVVRPVASVKLAAVLVAQALPLMLILFLFFPRVAPLWSVPLPGGAHSGMSDKVTPGDIARMTRSDEIAFRVVFDGEVPRQSKLYWRGIVYSWFDNGTWSIGPVPQLKRPEELIHWAGWSRDAVFFPERDGLEAIEYQVMLEPTRSNWLFTLDVPWPLTTGTALTRDFRLMNNEPVHSLFRYEVRSYPGARTDVDQDLPDWLRVRETYLPADDNPRTVAYARRLYSASSGTLDFVRTVLSRIRVQPYGYTLEPPVLPRVDSVDAFWFDTQRGFCVHYAGAFVYLMRAVGLPARMVGGYQGGEVNPVTGHLVVRQYDAHAWAEVWDPEFGWIHVDPTAAVAPQRIEQGLDAALSREDLASLSALTNLRMGEFPGLADLMYLVESMEHRWNIWVVGYDGTLQASYLKNLIGELSPLRIGLAMLVGGSASLLLVVLTLFWRRRAAPSHPAVRAFRRFCDALARSGLARLPEETPAAFLTRLARERGFADGQVATLIEQLDALLYNPERAADTAELRRLRRGLRRVRLQLALNATG